jgi:hypothetical protein
VRFRLTLLALGLVALAGCPKPLALRTYPPPSANELYEHVQRGQGVLSAVRARAKADLSDDSGGRVKIDLGLLVKRPDQLRVAGENALVGPLMTLATDGKSYQLIDLRNGRFSAGQVNPCSMSRLLRVAMPPTAAVDVLLGSAPLLAGAELSPQVLWDGRDGGLEVLTLRDGTGRTEILKLQVAGKAWDLRQAEGLDASGRVVWRVRHEGHADVPLVADGGQPATVRLPKVTHIEDLTHKSDVRLRWRERELNPTLEPELFHLEQPPGVPVDPDLCGGGALLAP